MLTRSEETGQRRGLPVLVDATKVEGVERARADGDVQREADAIGVVTAKIALNLCEDSAQRRQQTRVTGRRTRRTQKAQEASRHRRHAAPMPH